MSNLVHLENDVKKVVVIYGECKVYCTVERRRVARVCTFVSEVERHCRLHGSDVRTSSESVCDVASMSRLCFMFISGGFRWGPSRLCLPSSVSTAV